MDDRPWTMDTIVYRPSSIVLPESKSPSRTSLCERAKHVCLRVSHLPALSALTETVGVGTLAICDFSRIRQVAEVSSGRSLHLSGWVRFAHEERVAIQL